jgi:hypothetical protein
MTGGDGVITYYNGHHQKNTKFSKQNATKTRQKHSWQYFKEWKRGKRTVGNILKNENAAKGQVSLTWQAVDIVTRNNEEYNR